MPIAKVSRATMLERRLGGERVLISVKRRARQRTKYGKVRLLYYSFGVGYAIYRCCFEWLDNQMHVLSRIYVGFSLISKNIHCPSFIKSLFSRFNICPRLALNVVIKSQAKR